MNGTYQTNQAYRDMRDAFLLENEDFRTKVYFDHIGIPTVGKGIALVTWSKVKQDQVQRAVTVCGTP
ncbi:MAG: hypothetical protein GJT30_05295 [Geobacter sp.]|nr:hypothetical protein [Geobacter sp.]